MKPGDVVSIPLPIENFSDSDAEITSIKVVVAGIPDLVTSPNESISDSIPIGQTKIFTPSFTVGDVTEGPYTVNLQPVSTDDDVYPDPTDPTNNATVALFVDATAPIVSIRDPNGDEPAGDFIAYNSITALVSDDLSGVDHVDLFQLTQTEEIALASSQSSPAKFSNLQEGASYRVDAYDKAGNKSSKAFQVQGSNSPNVTLTLSSPEETSTYIYKGTHNAFVWTTDDGFRLQFRDEAQGIDHYLVTVDGNQIDCGPVVNPFSQITCSAGLVDGAYQFAVFDKNGDGTTGSFRRYTLKATIDTARSRAAYSNGFLADLALDIVNTSGDPDVVVDAYGTIQDQTTGRYVADLSAPIFESAALSNVKAHVKDLPPGTYSIVVTDNNGLEAEQGVEIGTPQGTFRQNFTNLNMGAASGVQLVSEGASNLLQLQSSGGTYAAIGTAETFPFDLFTPSNGGGTQIAVPPNTIGVAVLPNQESAFNFDFVTAANLGDVADEPENTFTGVSVLWSADTSPDGSSWTGFQPIIRREGRLGSRDPETGAADESIVTRGSALGFDLQRFFKLKYTLTPSTVEMRYAKPGATGPSLSGESFLPTYAAAVVLQGQGAMYSAHSQNGVCRLTAPVPGLACNTAQARALPPSRIQLSAPYLADPPVLTFPTAATLSLKFDMQDDVDPNSITMYVMAPGASEYVPVDNQMVDLAGGVVSTFVNQFTLDSVYIVLASTRPTGGTPGALPPVNVQVVEVASSTISLSWESNGNVSGTGYIVGFATITDEAICRNEPSTSFISVSTTSASVSNVMPSQPYSLTVCTLSAGSPLCADPVQVVTASPGQGSLDQFDVFSCGPGSETSSIKKGLAIAADAQGKLWEVVNDGGLVFLSRFGSSGLEGSVLLPHGDDKDGAWSVLPDRQGSVLALGTARAGDKAKDIVVYKVSPAFVLESSATFHAGSTSKAISWDGSGDLWITGFIEGSGPITMGLWRYSNATGQITQTASFSRGGPVDAGFAVRPMSGSVYVEGYTSTQPLSTPSLGRALWKFDGQGQGPIAGPFVDVDYLRSLDSTPNARLEVSSGTLFAAAMHSNAAGGTDLGLARYDASGEVLTDHFVAVDGVSLTPQAIGLDGQGNVAVAVSANTPDGAGYGVARFANDGGLIGLAANKHGKSLVYGMATLGSDLWLAVDGSTVPVLFLGDQQIPAVDVIVSSRVLDHTPPVTTLLVDGQPAVTGQAIVATDVLSLTAHDDLSGVAATFVGLDGNGAAVYNSSFTLPPGDRVVSFYSVDKAGNAEPPQAVSLVVVTTFTTTLILSPDTLNLKSNGQFVEADLAVSGSMSASSVDQASVRVTAVDDAAVAPLAPVKFTIEGSSLEMKLDRAALIGLLTPQQQSKVTISGRFKDGIAWTASAFIRTISPSTVKPNEAAELVHPKYGATVDLPAGALSKATDITLTSVGSVPEDEKEKKTEAATSLALAPTGKAFDFGPEGTQFSVPVTLTVPYDPVALGGSDPAKLTLAYWNAKTSAWEPLVSHVDQEKHVVVAQTSHFSQYQVLAPPPPGFGIAGGFGFGAAAASVTVETLEVACNPLRPSCRPMAFRNLPAGARLRLYTLAGNLVKDFASDGAGTAVWDGTNQDGQPAASGVYFLFAQGAGGSRKLKVAVQR